MTERYKRFFIHREFDTEEECKNWRIKWYVEGFDVLTCMPGKNPKWQVAVTEGVHVEMLRLILDEFEHGEDFGQFMRDLINKAKKEMLDEHIARFTTRA